MEQGKISETNCEGWHMVNENFEMTKEEDLNFCVISFNPFMTNLLDYSERLWNFIEKNKLCDK